MKIGNLIEDSVMVIVSELGRMGLLDSKDQGDRDLLKSVRARLHAKVRMHLAPKAGLLKREEIIAVGRAAATITTRETQPGALAIPKSEVDALLESVDKACVVDVALAKDYVLTSLAAQRGERIVNRRPTLALTMAEFRESLNS